jgi:endonuclease YncB( thermonuclease family)
MNAYVCENSDIGLLMFESQDADKYDRAVAPVYIANEGTSINTTINSFMDHIWDGFYTGQIR